MHAAVGLGVELSLPFFPCLACDFTLASNGIRLQSKACTKWYERYLVITYSGIITHVLSEHKLRRIPQVQEFGPGGTYVSDAVGYDANGWSSDCFQSYLTFWILLDLTLRPRSIVPCTLPRHYVSSASCTSTLCACTLCADHAHLSWLVPL